ncbi:MAG: UDP-N-acetylmuramate dehydrogenase [Clostridium sp.]|nr:UDP-N-acetylmuramate dehydrogenase [Clostridium sp.]
MKKEYLIHLLEGITDSRNIKVDEPMRKHTSFRVGGPADVLVTPVTISQLSEILKLCRDNNVPAFVMGNGTNLIVTDKGIRGVVIKIYDNLSGFGIEGDTIWAYAGILLSKLSNFALKNELEGLEFASGIPGTLGGAVAMNAGAYGGEMRNIVIETEYMDVDGKVRIIRNEEHEFGYRTSFIHKHSGIVLRSKIKLNRGKKDKIKEQMSEFMKRRREKQPLEFPSAGSVFKRPKGHFAGKLIEDCGLGGYRIGGAQVSDKHCGFIINVGNATAKDITNLIGHIQNTVQEKFGISMETEVKMVGEQ